MGQIEGTPHTAAYFLTPFNSVNASLGSDPLGYYSIRPLLKVSSCVRILLGLACSNVRTHVGSRTVMQVARCMCRRAEVRTDSSTSGTSAGASQFPAEMHCWRQPWTTHLEVYEALLSHVYLWMANFCQFAQSAEINQKYMTNMSIRCWWLLTWTVDLVTYGIIYNAMQLLLT